MSLTAKADRDAWGVGGIVAFHDSHAARMAIRRSGSRWARLARSARGGPPDRELPPKANRRRKRAAPAPVTVA